MARLAPAVVRLQAGQAVSALGDAVLTTSCGSSGMSPPGSRGPPRR